MCRDRKRAEVLTARREQFAPHVVAFLPLSQVCKQSETCADQQHLLVVAFRQLSQGNAIQEAVQLRQSAIGDLQANIVTHASHRSLTQAVSGAVAWQVFLDATQDPAGKAGGQAASDSMDTAGTGAIDLHCEQSTCSHQVMMLQFNIHCVSHVLRAHRHLQISLL